MAASPMNFADFTLDPPQRTLRRAGTEIDLSGRYFDALVLLASNAGQLVTKERFLAEVWRGVPVTDEALTQAVKALRQALGDDAASPRFIETVPKHGYRFIAPVRGGPTLPTGGRYAAVASDGAAGAIGGALAGVVGAMVYVSAGLVAPGLGSASIALALVSLCLALGLLGGLAIALGIASAGGSGIRPIIGGAIGGLLIGALAAIVGRDLFSLLFGRAPQAFTGALEGGLLGAAIGAAILLAGRASARWRQLLPAALLGSLAGGIIAITGGRLMAGSLAELGRSFPDTSLRFGGLSGIAMVAATMFEATLLCLAVTAALLESRRLPNR